jgi:hypothetical protein
MLPSRIYEIIEPLGSTPRARFEKLVLLEPFKDVKPGFQSFDSIIEEMVDILEGTESEKAEKLQKLIDEKVKKDLDLPENQITISFK